MQRKEKEERGEKKEAASVLGISPENLRTRHSHLHLGQRAGASTLLELPGFPPHTTQIKQACRGMKINFR